MFIGLLLRDRRTFKEMVKEEAMKEIERKYRINDWINALKVKDETRSFKNSKKAKLNIYGVVEFLTLESF